MQSPMFAALNRRQLLTQAAIATGLGAAMTLLPRVESRGEDAKMPRFKYAICNETFGTWPFDRAFALAAQCGYEGIEIAPFTLAEYVTQIPAKRRTEVRRLAEKSGLKLVGLHWLLAKTKGFHLTSAEADVRRKTVAYLGELAQFCADLGGRIMVFGSPKQRDLAPGMSKEEGMKHAAEVLRAAMPACEKADVTIALEPLGARGNQLSEHCGGCRGADERGRLAALPAAPRLQGDGRRNDAHPRLDPQVPRPVRPFSRQRPEPSGPRLWQARFRADYEGPATRSTIAAGFRWKCLITRPARNGLRGRASRTCRNVPRRSTWGSSGRVSQKTT